MTPSGWHDDASKRDAGHDELQIAAWKWLKDKTGITTRVTDRFGREYEYERLSVEIEKPFIVGGRIICFADIVEVFGYEDRKFYYRVLEVKPKIYSVGALLRQCCALENTIQEWKPTSRHTFEHYVQVIPLVKSDDLKIPLLLEVLDNGFATWNGSDLSWCHNK